MDVNMKFSERAAILAAINPSSQAAGAATSGWVSARDYHRLVALIQTGVLGASATVDAKFQQATDSSGTSAKDVANEAITQILKASGDNKQAIVELDVNALDAANGFAYVQFSLTVGTAASLTSGLLLGINPRYVPASAANAASVVQIVG
jgi:hypothetical protein